MTKLTEVEINQLVVPTTGSHGEEPVAIAHKRKLKIMLSAYHHFSRVFVEALDTEYLTHPVYLSYRDNVYDSSQEIIPWEIPLPKTNDST